MSLSAFYIWMLMFLPILFGQIAQSFIRLDGECWLTARLDTVFEAILFFPGLCFEAVSCSFVSMLSRLEGELQQALVSNPLHSHLHLPCIWLQPWLVSHTLLAHNMRLPPSGFTMGIALSGFISRVEFPTKCTTPLNTKSPPPAFGPALLWHAQVRTCINSLSHP